MQHQSAQRHKKAEGVFLGLLLGVFLTFGLFYATDSHPREALRVTSRILLFGDQVAVEQYIEKKKELLCTQ